jgi:glycerol kinase
VGFWKSRDAVKANWQVERTFHPSMKADDVRHRRQRWAQALSRSRDWEQHPPR